MNCKTCDKASFEFGVTEIDCMTHASRNFFELHANNKSALAEQACAISSCFTKSKVKSAICKRIYAVEYARKRLCL
jgi:hypothetical protein